MRPPPDIIADTIPVYDPARDTTEVYECPVENCGQRFVYAQRALFHLDSHKSSIAREDFRQLKSRFIDAGVAE